MVDNVKKMVSYIQERIKTTDKYTGVILSNNFDKFLDEIENKHEILFSEIPGFKALGKDKETGKFVFGLLNGKSVMVSLGRLHYNYGYEMKDIAEFIFLFKELGCTKLVMTASLGSLNKKIRVGDIVSITDHINFTGRNPLYNCNYMEKYGHTFIDMNNAYDEDLTEELVRIAKTEMSIKVRKGVLVESSGPTVETISETKFFYDCGADFVGFNICCEVIAAKYCSLPVVAYGIVTNYSSLLSANIIKHEDIVHNRHCASNYYLKLLKNFVWRITD